MALYDIYFYGGYIRGSDIRLASHMLSLGPIESAHFEMGEKCGERKH